MAKSNTLWTKTGFAQVAAPYATEDQPAAEVRAHAKIFGNLSDHRHYIIDYDPANGLAYCLTTNQEVCEFGYISLPELQEMNDNFMQEDPERRGRRRFICPPWQREIHGKPKGGYKIAEVQAKHAESLQQRGQLEPSTGECVNEIEAALRN